MRELLFAVLLLLPQVSNSTTGSLSGVVSYSDGTPAGALILRLVPIPEPGQRPPSARVIVTDANGVFNPRVAAGRYVIQTAASNPTFYPGVPTQSSATPITVTAGATTSGLIFSLPPSASGVRVQGHVALPQSYPIAPSGLRITLLRDPGKPMAADGTFEFTHVMPGTYLLSITAPGAQPVVLTVSDRDVVGVEISVPPLIPVQGIVSVEAGGTRSNFPLLIEALMPPGMTPATSPNGPYGTSVMPAPNGSFSTSLPPGDYRVTAPNLPAGNYIRSIAANSKEILGSSFKIDPAVSPVRLAVVVGASSGVRVAGRIKRSDADTDVELPGKVALKARPAANPWKLPSRPMVRSSFPDFYQAAISRE